jgi:hypothetical protein
MISWSLLILGLPTANATERMRAWRTLKASGAAVRDGVYLLPEQSAGRETFEAVERDVLAINGTAFLLSLPEREERFSGLFDRSDEYAKLMEELQAAELSFTGQRPADSPAGAQAQKAFGQLAAIDFFPGVSRQPTRPCRSLRPRLAVHCLLMSRVRTMRPSTGWSAANTKVADGQRESALGGPVGLCLADPSLHRCRRPIHLAGQSQRLPKRCAGLRF